MWQIQCNKCFDAVQMNVLSQIPTVKFQQNCRLISLVGCLPIYNVGFKQKIGVLGSQVIPGVVCDRRWIDATYACHMSFDNLASKTLMKENGLWIKISVVSTLWVDYDKKVPTSASVQIGNLQISNILRIKLRSTRVGILLSSKKKKNLFCTFLKILNNFKLLFDIHYKLV